MVKMLENNVFYVGFGGIGGVKIDCCNVSVYY